MRKRTGIVSFLAIVSGCGDPPREAATVPPPAERTGASQAASSPRFEWFASQYEDRGGLSFAVAETDNVRVTLECRKGTRSIRVSTVDPDALGTRLEFGSGQIRADVDATPSHDTMIDDSTYAAAVVDADHPVLAALEASGEMWVWSPEYPMRAASDADNDAIAQFFAFCEGRRETITPNWDR